MSDGPISQQEMIEMFGEAMPIEAVNLLANSADHMTLSELRRKLREIAATRTEPSTITEEGLVERVASAIEKTFYEGVDSGTNTEGFAPVARAALAASGHTALLSQIEDRDDGAVAIRYMDVLARQLALDGKMDECAVLHKASNLLEALSRPLPEQSAG